MVLDDLDEYADLIERISGDPDAALQQRDRVLLAQYAVQGAAIGLRHGGPRFTSVDADFIRKASAC
jgi:hypothetical protein